MYCAMRANVERRSRPRNQSCDLRLVKWKWKWFFSNHHTSSWNDDATAASISSILCENMQQWRLRMCIKNQATLTHDYWSQFQWNFMSLFVTDAMFCLIIGIFIVHDSLFIFCSPFCRYSLCLDSWVAECGIQWKGSESRPGARLVAVGERHSHITQHALFHAARRCEAKAMRECVCPHLNAAQSCVLHRVTDYCFLKWSPGFYDAWWFVLFHTGRHAPA